jgi:hypothetical protein
MNEQNFANHVKWVPAFHFFAVPALILNFGWSVSHAVKLHFSFEAIVGVLTALAILMTPFLARTFALKVQDRVIRLEERLRFERLLSADLKPRIGEFTPGQLVALRFAGDAELPALAQRVLAEKLTDGKAIKQCVKNWRPDHLRA